MQANGHLVLLPKINLDNIAVYECDKEGDYIYDTDGDYILTDEIIRFSHEFRGKILEFDKLLRKPTETSVKPEWSSASDFRLSNESDIETEITTINEKIEHLEQEKRLKQENLEAEISLRGLLYLKGRELEELVLSSLQCIGFSATNFKDGDSEFDAVFTSEEGRFIGEVEGKDNKAINVDKISQLQRNIIEDLKKPEVKEAAYGVLFGNGYRWTDPRERPEEFTEKVLSYSNNTGIRLVKTTDLFYILRNLKKSRDNDFSKACREAFKNTPGGLISFPRIPEETNKSEPKTNNRKSDTQK